MFGITRNYQEYGQQIFQDRQGPILHEPEPIGNSIINFDPTNKNIDDLKKSNEQLKLVGRGHIRKNMPHTTPPMQSDEIVDASKQNSFFWSPQQTQAVGPRLAEGKGMDNPRQMSETLDERDDDKSRVGVFEFKSNNKEVIKQTKQNEQSKRSSGIKEKESKIKEGRKTPPEVNNESESYFDAPVWESQDKGEQESQSKYNKEKMKEQKNVDKDSVSDDKGTSNLISKQQHQHIHLSFQTHLQMK
ncbi:MAG: hypothetical protein EZS28_010370 [Streblomastix strix]|uniref:Uncharacterized protein n=1 Tax=Streblomastix strix TaxID=222440 RepID=A0A5J4WHC3_9EUKA|nr:MAG: hypothetical protein EZS28_010370 [Streblomastix strix]